MLKDPNCSTRWWRFIATLWKSEPATLCPSPGAQTQKNLGGALRVLSENVVTIAARGPGFALDLTLYLDGCTFRNIRLANTRFELAGFGWSIRVPQASVSSAMRLIGKSPDPGRAEPKDRTDHTKRTVFR